VNDQLLSTVIGERDASAPVTAACRHCGARLQQTFVDLGMSPLCESFLTRDQLNGMEPFYPLHVLVCDKCFLVQLQEYVSPQSIFSHYAYFSSYAESWLAHVRNYTDQMIDRWKLGPKHQVVEIASNDGYLLQYFVARGIPSLGIEPAANVAAVAVGKGIPTDVAFFGRATARRLASEGRKADLLIGNNVLAHVPDIDDFVGGVQILLAADGVISMEFPHLLRLMEGNQFDTIYHEHFSYLSFMTVCEIFSARGLRVFDVEELPTHGGSLRIFASHRADDTKSETARVRELLNRELNEGFGHLEKYTNFKQRVEETKWRLLDFLIQARRSGKSVVGYGAPGKGNTLLNYCGIRTDFLDYTVDRNPFKHGKFLPGTHIPIYPPERISETQPDFVLILPWNVKDEIMAQMAHVRTWGGQFVVPIPEVKVYR
jgi:SAM-dependent methyltransferase